MSEFEKQYSNPPRLGTKPRKQWTLSGLLFLTTLIAVAASGYSRGETAGVWIALFSFWFMCLGLACTVLGATTRSTSRYFMLAIGIVMLGIGIMVFATFQNW